MTLSRDAPRYVALVGAAVVGAATVAGAGVVRSYLARRRRRPACEPPPSLQLFDRYSSNNSARIRFWIYIRGLEARIGMKLIRSGPPSLEAAPTVVLRPSTSTAATVARA